MTNQGGENEMTTPEDDLRAALAPDGTIGSLDPARVIAGARRRRKVRALATTAVAVIAVAGVATGGFLAGGQSLGQDPDPADPGPTTLVSPSPPRTPIPSAKNTATVAPHATPGAVPISTAKCVAALNGEPGPGPAAAQRNLLSDESGTTIVIADGHYWTACDNTSGQEVSARRPERLKKPSAQDADAFAVANNVVDRPAGQRDFYWAGGMLPAGVAAIRYTFPDGAIEDAAVDGGFWLMRHLSDQTPPTGPPTTRIRVRLLSASGTVVNELQLVWGPQTCAQITHGC